MMDVLKLCRLLAVMRRQASPSPCFLLNQWSQEFHSRNYRRFPGLVVPKPRNKGSSVGSSTVEFYFLFLRKWPDHTWRFSLISTLKFFWHISPVTFNLIICSCSPFTPFPDIVVTFLLEIAQNRSREFVARVSYSNKLVNAAPYPGCMQQKRSARLHCRSSI